MAWSHDVDIDSVAGNMAIRGGTYTTSGATTGGNINTGLHQCVHMELVATGTPVVADAPTVDETLPCDGTAITIICTAATTGRWLAYGY
jgi:hypothetical protein